MPIGLLDAIPIAANIFGAFGASSRAKKAAAERQRLLRDYEGLINNDYSQSIGNTNRNVLSETGLLGDALRTTGANLGAANAAGGIYNSSATAGALSNYANQGQATLADMALKGRQQSEGILSAGRKFLLGQRLGLADNSYNDAREQLGSAQGGLMSGVGALLQRLYAQNQGKAPGGGRSSVLDLNKPLTLSGQGMVPAPAGMGSASYGSGNRMSLTGNTSGSYLKRPKLFASAMPSFSY